MEQYKSKFKENSKSAKYLSISKPNSESSEIFISIFSSIAEAKRELKNNVEYLSIHKKGSIFLGKINDYVGLGFDLDKDLFYGIEEKLFILKEGIVVLDNIKLMDELKHLNTKEKGNKNEK
jgi:hypothetical protein